MEKQNAVNPCSFAGEIASNMVAAELRKTVIQTIRRFYVREYGKDTALEFDKELQEKPDMTKIDIAYTTTLDERLEIQATVDLKEFTCTVSLRPFGEEKYVCVETYRHGSLSELNDFLEGISFDSLVWIEPRGWDTFNASPVGRKWIQETFPVGTRVELIHMDDIQAPPVGAKGTIYHIDARSQLHTRWDIGSGLALNYGVDEFNIIEEENAT